MSIIVQKYGGSSVADIDKIRIVADKVVATKQKGHDVVVVVSAMGNTTDELLQLARQLVPNPDSRELDMLVTVGERISMALLSMAIHALGHEAISLTGSQCGIITNHSAGGARIIEVRPFRVQDELAAGNIVIVAGYQGMSYKREVTTLGRGGSDTTAVALAAALSAEACEIYSDVAGVFTSDPRVVDDAHKLDAITYEEMEELSRLGAKVLNQQAVAFARDASIALYAKATSGDGPGTVITRPDGFPDHLLKTERSAGVTGIAGRKDIMLIEYECPPSGDDRSGTVLQALREVDLIYAGHRSGRDALVALVSIENVPSVAAFVKQLRRRYAENIGVALDLALVSAVGAGVGQRTTTLQRLSGALDEQQIPAKFVFTSRSSVSALVYEDDLEAAMQTVHSEFLSEPPQAASSEPRAGGRE